MPNSFDRLKTNHSPSIIFQIQGEIIPLYSIMQSFYVCYLFIDLHMICK